MEYTAYIGLGSNVASAAGTPAETVLAAVRALGKLGRVAAQSSLYRTAPVGWKEQPDFVNAAICLETTLKPEQLLREMLGIERSFGRDREASVPKGPRTLDLDLLLVFEEGGAAVVCDSGMLTLPHPEMTKRRFVLEPLAEIAPDLRHPVIHKTICELIQELADAGDEVLRIQD